MRRTLCLLAVSKSFLEDSSTNATKHLLPLETLQHAPIKGASSHAVPTHILQNRRLHFIAAQRRHLHARVNAVFGGGRQPTSGTPPQGNGRAHAATRYSEGLASGIDLVTAADPGMPFTSHLEVQVRPGCVVCTQDKSAQDRTESEERAVVAALQMFPTSLAWQHMCEAIDSKIFHDVARLAGLAEVPRIEIRLAFTQEAEWRDSHPSHQPSISHRQALYRDTAAAARRYVATVVATSLTEVHSRVLAGHTLVTARELKGDDGDESGYPLALARETAHTPRNAAKLALAAAILRLDEWASEQAAVLLSELQCLRREGVQVMVSSLGSQTATLKRYLSGDPVFPGRYHSAACDEPPATVDPSALGVVRQACAYRAQYRYGALTFAPNPQRPLSSFRAVADAVALGYLVRHCVLPASSPTYSLTECLHTLMDSSIAAFKWAECEHGSEDEEHQQWKLSLTNRFLLCFASELRTLWGRRKDDVEVRDTTRTYRLLSAVFPHVLRRCPDAIALAAGAPLNMLQEGFLTLAYVAIESSQAPELLERSRPHDAGTLGTRTAAITQTLERLTNAAAWSLHEHCASNTALREAFGRELHDMVHSRNHFTQGCFARTARLAWDYNPPQTPGSTAEASVGLRCTYVDSPCVTFLETLRRRTRGSYRGMMVEEPATVGGEEECASTVTLASLSVFPGARVKRATAAVLEKPAGHLTLEQRSHLLQVIGLPSSDHPVLTRLYSQRHPDFVAENSLSSLTDRCTNGRSGSASKFLTMATKGIQIASALAAKQRRQDQIFVPDVPLMIYVMREALGLPASYFPTIQFFQEAKHDPARRVVQLARGRSGDVDVLTRVVVRWPHTGQAGGQTSLVAVAESVPEKHGTDADGLPLFDPSVSAYDALYSLHDTGEPRGPLRLLIGAVCNLYRTVMGERAVEEGFPLMSVHEAAVRARISKNPLGEWHSAGSASVGRRGLDFLLYSWFGAAPQVRCYEIMAYPDTGKERPQRGERLLAERAQPVHMFRAMLLYDILGQRVLFAETHDMTIEAATTRMEYIAQQLNLPPAGFRTGLLNADEVKPAATVGAASNAQGAALRCSVVAHRPYRAIACFARHQRTARTLARLLSVAINASGEHRAGVSPLPILSTADLADDTWAPVTRLLRVHANELAAIFALMDAALACHNAARERASEPLAVTIRFQPTPSNTFPEAERATLCEGGHDDLWWGQRVAGLGLPPVCGVAEVRLVRASLNEEERNTRAAEPAGRSDTVLSLRKLVVDDQQGLLLALTRLCASVATHVLLSCGTGVHREHVERLLRACEEASPLLHRPRDGFPVYDRRFYHAPQLLGTLLQGLSGRYECHYERRVAKRVVRARNDSTAWATAQGSARGAVADTPQANPSGMHVPHFYASTSFHPRVASWQDDDAVDELREEALSRASEDVSVVRCTITVATLGSRPNDGGGGQGADSLWPPSGFPLGMGYGRTKREARLSAAWHALRQNFPDVVAQLSAFRQMCDLQRSPVRMLALAAGIDNEGSTHAEKAPQQDAPVTSKVVAGPLPRLACVWRRETLIGTRTADATKRVSQPLFTVCCDVYMEDEVLKGGEQESARRLLVSARAATSGVAYERAASKVLRRASTAAEPLDDVAGAAGTLASAAPYSLWNPAGNYEKSVWHALCGAIAAGSDGGSVRVMFLSERDLRSGVTASMAAVYRGDADNCGSVRFSAGSVGPGVSMLAVQKVKKPGSDSCVSTILLRVAWADLIARGLGVDGAKGSTKAASHNVAASLATTTISTVGTAFLLGVGASLWAALAQTVYRGVTPNPSGPGIAAELASLLTLIARHELRRPLGAHKVWRAPDLLWRSARLVEAVTGLQAQATAVQASQDRHAPDGGKWRAELVVYLPLFHGPSGRDRLNSAESAATDDEHATSGSQARPPKSPGQVRGRLPLMVFAAEGKSEKQAEEAMARDVATFANAVAAFSSQEMR